MSISGFASGEGTKRYAARFAKKCAPGHFRDGNGLTLSSIGIGTYLGDVDSKTDKAVREAVKRSVAGGINVIDTAINYRREHGERSVGLAFGDLIADKTVERSEVLICTKGGFLPHGPKWFAERFLQEPDTPLAEDDMVANCHCMHPAYLADQLEWSRGNLGVDTVDVYYVHNPETQRGQVSADVFERRLGEAFAFLESAVREGKIRAYGIATWPALRLEPEAPQHISLERCRDIARAAAAPNGDHFKYVQLPLNLAMTEALTKNTQTVNGRAVPALVAASALGLTAMTSGSIGQGKFKTLPADLAQRLGANLQSDFQRALQFTRSALGVTTALVGMKRPEHVGEDLALCAKPPLARSAFAKVFSPRRV